jgi:hypothetical protein
MHRPIGAARAHFMANGRNAMMKIEVRESPSKVVLHVQGRLAGACVSELENCWRDAQSAGPHREISVDLKSVTCVDRSGRRLLETMHRGGAHFLRADLAVQDILTEIMEQAECRH